MPRRESISPDTTIQAARLSASGAWTSEAAMAAMAADGLSSLARLTWIVISVEDGRRWSAAELATMTGASHRSTRRAIAELRSMGWAEGKESPGHPTAWTATIPDQHLSAQVAQDGYPGQYGRGLEDTPANMAGVKGKKGPNPGQCGRGLGETPANMATPPANVAGVKSQPPENTGSGSRVGRLIKNELKDLNSLGANPKNHKPEKSLGGESVQPISILIRRTQILHSKIFNLSRCPARPPTGPDAQRVTEFFMNYPIGDFENLAWGHRAEVKPGTKAASYSWAFPPAPNDVGGRDRNRLDHEWVTVRIELGRKYRARMQADEDKTKAKANREKALEAEQQAREKDLERAEAEASPSTIRTIDIYKRKAAKMARARKGTK